MAYTISTHTGSAVARGHNIRDQRCVSRDGHINPDGVHETWHDETERQAYHRLFDTAQEAYNAKQRRPERRIKDYYSDVSKDSKQHTAYEMIVAIGSKDNQPDVETGKGILQEFVSGWADRNPNMDMIGAYYHADEQGVPHVHIDFIPVAHGYKRGMATQTGYAKALDEMGFGGRRGGANWWARENQALEDICRARGLEIEHPERGKGSEHAHTVAYQITQEAHRQEQEITARVQAMQDSIDSDKSQAAEVVKRVKDAVAGVDSLQGWTPDIVKQKPARSGLLFQREAMTTLRTDDFEKLQQIADVRAVVDGYKDSTAKLQRSEKQLKQAAKQIHKTRMDAHETAVDDRVRAAEMHTAQALQRAEEAERQRDQALQQAREAQEMLAAYQEAAQAEMALYRETLEFYPDEWAEMQRRTARAREMEHLYYEHDGGYLYYMSDGASYDRAHLLAEYVAECEKWKIPHDQQMWDAATKLKDRNRDDWQR